LLDAGPATSATGTPAGGVVPERLLTPAELAVWLNVERNYVYEHAASLGALRLGDGPRAGCASTPTSFGSRFPVR
jgi:hypothetical protein